MKRGRKKEGCEKMIRNEYEWEEREKRMMR